MPATVYSDAQVGNTFVDHAGQSPLTPGTLAELLATPPHHLDRVDIARANLLCAEGLPGAEDIDLSRDLALLDEMADTVRRQTERSWRIFRLKPGGFNGSENVFRVLTMQHVLRTQFTVKYDPAVHAIVESGKEWRPTDSSEVFIHGILGEKRTGTCSSLPIFSIAIGRRLGYPLKLVQVPQHRLFRWDGGGETFNIEHTPAGSDIRTDDYYYAWPHKWDASMFAFNERTKAWLRSLTPWQETSEFLSSRIRFLRNIGQYDEALACVKVAERFDPLSPAFSELRFNILECSGRLTPIHDAQLEPLLKPPAAALQLRNIAHQPPFGRQQRVASLPHAPRSIPATGHPNSPLPPLLPSLKASLPNLTHINGRKLT